jgi:hypothetical protein
MTYIEQRRQHILNDRPLPEKKRYVIPKQSEKRKAKLKEQKEAGTDNSIDRWFDYHIEHSKMFCENCLTDLSHYSYEDWRASQHHIIEKSKTNGCPSVAGELDNHMVLGKWCCHHKLTGTPNNIQYMERGFRIAKERFELFKNKILESEKSKIPTVFQNIPK